jgi:hypothetical protein
MYETITVSVVLDGSEIWSVTLRKDHGLTVSEVTDLRKLFGLPKEEVT